MSKADQELDREYVLAALLGLLLHECDTTSLIQKYSIGKTEQRRVACVLIQHTMQQLDTESHKRELARIATLAEQYDIDDETLTRLAWEVLRGVLDDPDNEKHAAYFVLKYCLQDKIPSGSTFNFGGVAEAFVPSGECDYRYSLIGNFVFRDDGCDYDLSALPAALQQLLEDSVSF
jgi:hypothetical protein